jgi:hypothetical protein
MKTADVMHRHFLDNVLPRLPEADDRTRLAYWLRTAAASGGTSYAIALRALNAAEMQGADLASDDRQIVTDLRRIASLVVPQSTSPDDPRRRLWYALLGVDGDGRPVPPQVTCEDAVAITGETPGNGRWYNYWGTVPAVDVALALLVKDRESAARAKRAEAGFAYFIKDTQTAGCESVTREQLIERAPDTIKPELRRMIREFEAVQWEAPRQYSIPDPSKPLRYGISWGYRFPPPMEDGLDDDPHGQSYPDSREALEDDERDAEAEFEDWDAE